MLGGVFRLPVGGDISTKKLVLIKKKGTVHSLKPPPRFQGNLSPTGKLRLFEKVAWFSREI